MNVPHGKMKFAVFLMADGCDYLTGQTIAIVDAYNAPKVQSDLAAFDKKFGLAAPPSFKVINQAGGNTLPRSKSTFAYLWIGPNSRSQSKMMESAFQTSCQIQKDLGFA